MRKSLLLILSALFVFSACTQPVENLESETTEVEIEKEVYVNTVFAYQFEIPEGVNVNTQSVVLYPIEHGEAIEVGVEFSGESAGLSSMREVGTFPALANGRIDLTAQEYVELWWKDNANDTNPNVTPVLEPIFEKTINGITWFGFAVDESMVSANGTGGGLLEVPRTVLMAKNGETFYRWQFDASLDKEVFSLLENFEFTE